MNKEFFCYLFLMLSLKGLTQQPPVKVAGAMKNIMQKADLSAYCLLDTLDRTHLFGLGPVAGLKGELLILDGKIYSSTRSDNGLLNKQDQVNKASMLVYCYAKEWEKITVNVSIGNYAELEKIVAGKATEYGYDISVPFVFRIEIIPGQADYHVIDWKDSVSHTAGNHKLFAYNGTIRQKKINVLGFYSERDHGIFTHHSSNIHVHLVEDETGLVGHLDDIRSKGEWVLYLPSR